MMRCLTSVHIIKNETNKNLSIKKYAGGGGEQKQATFFIRGCFGVWTGLCSNGEMEN